MLPPTVSLPAFPRAGCWGWTEHDVNASYERHLTHSGLHKEAMTPELLKAHFDGASVAVKQHWPSTKKRRHGSSSSANDDPENVALQAQLIVEQAKDDIARIATTVIGDMPIMTANRMHGASTANRRISYPHPPCDVTNHR